MPPTVSFTSEAMSTMAQAHAELLLRDAPLFADRYQLQTVLNTGVNNILYLAVDLHSKTQVLLKYFAESAYSAYLRELAAVADYQHPHIIQHLAHFEVAPQRGCLVYEYLSGGNLRQWLSSGHPLELQTVIEILRQILNALQHLHTQRNVIHCDIRPDIILTHVNPNGEAVFIINDLSYICPAKNAKAEEPYHVSNPCYSAPEGFYEKAYFNSDLYSLGIMTYELLTSARPFLGTAAEIARAHLAQRAELSRINYVPLRDFVGQLLVKNSRLRIETAENALELLEKLLRGHAVEVVLAEERGSGHAFFLDEMLQTPLQIDVNYFNEIGYLPLSDSVHQLFTLHANNQPIVGVAYDTHTEFLTPTPANQVSHILNTVDCVQLLSTQHLLYAQKGGLSTLNINTLQTTHLHQYGAQNLSACCFNGDYLLWRTRDEVHLRHLSNETELSYRVSCYAFKPQLHLLPNGYVFTSSGQYNQVVQLRDLNINVLDEWSLDGPVLEWTDEDNVMLAITLNFAHHEQYSLWRLALDRDPRKLAIPNGVRHYGCTKGRIFWLTFDNELYFCGPDLQPYSAGKIPLPVDLIQPSLDHRFIAATVLPRNQRPCVVFWRNMLGE